jgi:hypothetical protein
MICLGTRRIVLSARALRLAALALGLAAPPAFAADERVPVTAETFVRAESDVYMGNIVKDGGFGKFNHVRELAPIDHQLVIRQNRDTLYSAGVFDLDAGPLTITLPDAGERFMSMQVITEDHYSPSVYYDAGSYTLDREAIGTRYVAVAIRTLVVPTDPVDVAKVHALQDAVGVKQASPGTWAVPKWDPASQKKVRDALLVLGSTIPDSKRMFGTPQQVDPIRHLIGSATAWGGNPETEATYLNVTPAKNDGVVVHRLTVKDVPVDGFWSINVYDAKGYFEKNALGAYSLNDVTAQKAADGSVTVQFGGCDGKIPNCLPITPGWNYIVRLYRPRAEILNGKWTFPPPQPVS